MEEADMKSSGKRSRRVVAFALIAALSLILAIVAGWGEVRLGRAARPARPAVTGRCTAGDRGHGLRLARPVVGMYAQDYAAWMLMYPNLVQFSNDLEPQPDFAESWSTSDDGLTSTWSSSPAPYGQTASRSPPQTPRSPSTRS